MIFFGRTEIEGSPPKACMCMHELNAAGISQIAVHNLLMKINKYIYIYMICLYLTRLYIIYVNIGLIMQVSDETADTQLDETQPPPAFPQEEARKNSCDDPVPVLLFNLAHAKFHACLDLKVTELALAAKKPKMDADDWKSGPYNLNHTTCSDQCGHIVACLTRIRRYAQNVKRSSKEVQEMYEKDSNSSGWGCNDLHACASMLCFTISCM